MISDSMSGYNLKHGLVFMVQSILTILWIIILTIDDSDYFMCKASLG